jgi:hypothetical protein
MHSPEPWRHITGKCLDYIADANGNSVLGDAALDDPVMPSSEEMERIVACVNFCREFNTEFLKTHHLKHLTEDSGFQSLADVPEFSGLVAIVKETT